MKVLGISDSHSEKYICEVSHDELCKLMSKSIYGNDKLEKLKVGDIMNLGAGYDFLQSIRRVCSEMTECIAVDKVILLRLKEALEIGRDSAALEAENYHSSMKGYRENMHKQLDSDVETIKSAEDEIQALIDSLPMIPTCPLSDDEIIKLGYKAGFAIDTVENEETSDEEYGFLNEDGEVDNSSHFKFSRLIEKHHGIF